MVAEKLQELVEYLAKSLVDDPESVQVNAFSRRDGVLLELTVAGRDMGRVIGQRGRVVNALRTLVEVAAAQHGTSAELEIVD